jgi:hypothetical protein
MLMTFIHVGELSKDKKGKKMITLYSILVTRTLIPTIVFFVIGGHYFALIY